MRAWPFFLGALLVSPSAGADGAFPDPQQILLPAESPEQIVLATNFGLLISEDEGESWLYSCEQKLNAYASPYVLGASPSRRLFAIASGAGLAFSDDDSCGWTASGGKLAAVLPYALAIDPSNSQRVYVIGVPRDDFRGGESLYVSADGGLTFGEPVFTAPEQSALLTVMVAPSRPSTLFASLFAAPDSRPSLLRSTDFGEHWEVVADLSTSLGPNPFELLAIDPTDENRIYVRLLGAESETLATSEDGGLSFTPKVSISGRLRAFLQLASGTILVAGTDGTLAIAYRSEDGGQSFEPWLEAPHVHVLAERNGSLYVAADNFLDGYALAVSQDEGEHLTPLTSFSQVRGVKSCVAEACAESCAYYAGIRLWPQAVCGSEAGAGPSGTLADTGSGGAGDVPAPKPTEVSAAEGGAGQPLIPPAVDASCSCSFVLDSGTAPSTALLAFGLLVATWLGQRVRRSGRARDL